VWIRQEGSFELIRGLPLSFLSPLDLINPLGYLTVVVLAPGSTALLCPRA